jgi:hypothetical protein
MPKKDKFDPDAMAKAMFESQELEQTQAYVSRGRGHESLTVDQLRAVWVRAFKQWAASLGSADPRELDDVSAEFRLRKIEPPFNLVSDERRALVEEVRKAGPHNPGLLQKIREFREELRTKPKN